MRCDNYPCVPLAPPSDRDALGCDAVVHVESNLGMRNALYSAVTLLMLGVASLTCARDGLFATPYGSLTADLLEAMGAEEVPCYSVVDAPEVGFVVRPAGASYLAEVLEAVTDGYGQAGLSRGAWRAANGVWSVELRFGDGSYGKLEVYLAEVGGAVVHGILVLSGP